MAALSAASYVSKTAQAGVCLGSASSFGAGKRPQFWNTSRIACFFSSGSGVLRMVSPAAELPFKHPGVKELFKHVVMRLADLAQTP